MGKIKSALSTAGKVLDAYADRSLKVNDMTNEIMRRCYDVDADQARKVAAVLVDRAEVTWK
jgi:hypothetical protein